MSTLAQDIRDWLNAKWRSLSNRKASLDYIRVGEDLSGRAIRISFHDGEVVDVSLPGFAEMTIVHASNVLRDYAKEIECAK